MKPFHSLAKRLFLPALVAAALGGCISDQYTENMPAEEDMYLLVELKIPGVSTPASRAFADNAQEKKIDEVDVLVFRDNGTGYDETFVYHALGKLDESTGSTYKVKVKKSDPRGAKYRLVFLANLSTEVADAISSNPEKFRTTSTKAETLAAITFDAAAEYSTTKPLPMWGESKSTYIVTLVEENIGTVYMLRSVARVDVLLNPNLANSSPENPSASGFDDNLFELNSVKVYNASSMGAAVPQVEVTGMYSDAMEVNAPSVPDIATFNPMYNTSNSGEREEGLMRTIYIAESANTTEIAGSKTNKDEASVTYLIISGYYKESEALSWYRLDFTDPDDSSLRLDILRNHCYMFNITSVNGPGYPNEPDAIKSLPIHIDYKAIGWSNGTISNISLNQTQHELSVSQGVFTFSWEARDASSTDNTLIVTTTHPGGWKVDRITYAAESQTGWLSHNWTSGATEVKLGLDANNSSTNPMNLDRIGYIHLLAGMLTYKVKVTQNPL